MPKGLNLKLFEICSYFISVLFIGSTITFSYPIQIFYTLSTGSYYPRQPWQPDYAAILLTCTMALCTVACQAILSSSVRKQAILELPMSVEDPNLMISNLV